MGRLFDGPGIWIVLVVVLLLFGATRLPALARSIGQSTKIFREEMKTDKPTDDVASGATTPPAAPAASTPAASTPAAPTTTDSGTSGATPKP